MKICNDCKKQTNDWYEYKPYFILWILCWYCLQKDNNIADRELKESVGK